MTIKQRRQIYKVEHGEYRCYSTNLKDIYKFIKKHLKLDETYERGTFNYQIEVIRESK